VNGEFRSGNLTLARYLARPAGRQGPLPGVILCHGFPIGPLDARQSAGTFPELIDRMANELGWVAMTFTFRGCGTSEGDFSLQGWVDDLRAAIDNLIAEAAPTGIWLVGTNTGGSVVTCVAADDPRVRGAALLSPRADFDDWAAQPRRFLEHAREIGAIRTPSFPPSFDEWARELRWCRTPPASRSTSHRGATRLARPPASGRGRVVVTVEVSTVPFPRGCDDVVETVHRVPIEQLRGPRRIGEHRNRVSGAPRCCLPRH
jgi:alpha/beta superfamily hydrolase